MKDIFQKLSLTLTIVNGENSKDALIKARKKMEMFAVVSLIQLFSRDPEQSSKMTKIIEDNITCTCIHI